MVLLVNDLEGGTNGTQLTAGSGGNSGGVSGNFFDTLQGGATATQTFDNTHAAHGSLSLKILTGGTASESLVAWDASLGSGLAQVWFRVYAYFTANPGTNAPLVRVMTASGGSQCARLIAQTNGKIELAYGTGTTNAYTTTASFPTNAWYRVEGFVVGSTTVGQVSASFYFTSPDGTTPDETFTSTATLNTTGTIGQTEFGQTAVTAANNTFWLDDLGASTVGYLGPAVTMPPAMTALQAVKRAAFW